ncbi:MAG: hypothetical protein V3R94_02390 [Acidobacteriota bacterium]
MHRVSLGLLAVVWICLLAVGATLTVEHYDGYEYILTGMAVAGEGTYFFPKNPVLSTILSALYGIFERLELDTRSLANYHLPLVILNLGLALIVAKWIRLFCPILSTVTIAAMLCVNRSFIHYVPFALPDVLIACSIGIWLYADATLPIRSPAGKISRIMILGLCALQRPQTVIIPAASLLTAVIKDRRRLASATLIVLGSVVVYISLNTVFFYRGVILGYQGGLSSLGTQPNLVQAITGQFEFLYYFFGRPLSYPILRVAPVSSLWAYSGAMMDALNPIGTGLLVVGVFQLRKFRQSPQWDGLMGGALIGSLCFFMFLLYVRATGPARYITPLIPALTLIECLGLAWLTRRRAALGTLALVGVFCLAVIPEARYFYHPYYRADLERRTTRNIKEWSRSEPIYFTGSAQSPFYSQENVVHDFQPDFYVYRGLPAVNFYSGRSLRYLGQEPTFRAHGFPIPDDLDTLIEPNRTLIIPPMRIYQEALVPWESLEVPPGTQVTPLYAVRWSLDSPPGTPCSPKVQEVCVEVYTPSPGMGF